jgi:hypothetical protein
MIARKAPATAARSSSVRGRHSLADGNGTIPKRAPGVPIRETTKAVAKQMMPLRVLAADFADALARVDADRLAHKRLSPGIGPYGEADAVRAALIKLRSAKPETYADAVVRRVPDLLIPGQWAIEFKVARPFGDNGRAAEHWSENLLHPYAGNISSLGDCLKLLSSNLDERKAAIIFGFEHTPPIIPLDAAVLGFEVLAERVMKLRLTPRIEERRDGLIHPVHQQLRVFAYEVLATGSD